VSVERGTDYERRALWLGLAVALIASFGSGGAFFGDGDLQIWLFIASRVALGLSLLLSLLLVVPELRAPLGQRFRSQQRVFAWAFGLLVLALLIAIASSVEAAIDALDEDLPFD
jgi:hypothetical protein